MLVVANFEWQMVSQRILFRVVFEHRIRRHIQHRERLLSLFRERRLLHRDLIGWVDHHGRRTFTVLSPHQRATNIVRGMTQLRIQVIEIILRLHVLLDLEGREIDKAITLIIFGL